MNTMLLLWRNLKWRCHNGFTIVITVLQPLLWLILYSAVAEQTMRGAGIANYTAFVLPGLIVLVSFSCCSSSGIMNYLMKADGSFYRILIAPVRRSSIIVGQLLEAVLCTFFEVGILFIAAAFFSVEIAYGVSGLLLIALLIFLTAFFMAEFAYAVSLTLPNEVVYETAMTAIVLPFFFLSTALFPADTLTGVLKTAVELNPFTHVINALRSLILQGSIEISALLWTLSLLFSMCGVGFWWAYYRLQREMDLN